MDDDGLPTPPTLENHAKPRATRRWQVKPALRRDADGQRKPRKPRKPETSRSSETSKTSETADARDRHSARDLLLLPGAARQSGPHVGRWTGDRPSNRRGD